MDPAQEFGFPRDERGYDIRTVQESLDHQGLRTILIYTHVLNRGWGAVRSLADTVVRPLRGPNLTPGNLRALDCGAPQPSAPTSAPTQRQEHVCWREDSGQLRQFIGAR